MVFGEARTFAIEADVTDIHAKWIHGRLRLWVHGEPLGDFDDTSDLATSARWGRVFLAASPRRSRPDLDRASAREVYETLYGRYVQPVLAKPRKQLSGPWDRDPYLLDDVGESALRDKVAVVVVRTATGADRFVVNCFDGDRVFDAVVPEGFCDEVVDSYCTWVERLRT